MSTETPSNVASAEHNRTVALRVTRLLGKTRRTVPSEGR